MTDFLYGLLNWTWVTSRYVAKGGSAAYQKGVTASQRYQDNNTISAAREDPITYSAPADRLARYNYPSLRPNSHIRILLLEPGSGGDLLQCSLEESDLDSQPKFNALSYCWGATADTCIINCEKGTLSIPKNLYDALLRLRKPHSRVRIWADALCIDQNDLSERRQQVQLMRRIYQQAEKCLVWLGAHTELDALAFKLLNTIQDYLRTQPSDQNAKVLIPGSILAKYSTTPGEWDALMHLFSRPWFERVWTLQEITLPRRVLMTCGKFSFDGNLFYEIVEFLNSSQLAVQMIGLQGGYLQSLKVAALRREFHEHTSARDLLDTLRSARDRDATDPRDKVIGILGLCQIDPNWASKLGYHMTPKEIYLSVAKNILTSSSPFRLFHACYPALTNTSTAESLPSWVPDWNNRIAVVPCIQHFERIETYTAGGSRSPSIMIGQSADGAELLNIRGKVVSSLKSFVDRHSDALKRNFQNAHYPQKSMRRKIRDWYAYIAFTWVFDYLDDEGRGRPEMTIGQFFLAVCWSITPASCDTKMFWETMTCALTDGKRNEALTFKSQLMQYAKRNRQHDVSNTVQASFLQNMESWTRSRKFVVTATGEIGWVPLEAQRGDVICVFKGARLPYVLRQNADEDTYTMIGHCFVHGIMFGEVTMNDELSLEDIVLR